MNVEDVRLYRDRWKAVQEIERQELRAATVQTNWKQLNSIARRSIRLGLTRGEDDSEMEVFRCWVKIKERYELSQRT